MLKGPRYTRVECISWVALKAWPHYLISLSLLNRTKSKPSNNNKLTFSIYFWIQQKNKFWNKSSKWVSNWLGLFALFKWRESTWGTNVIFIGSLPPTFLRNVHKVKKLLWNVSSNFFGNFMGTFIISYFNLLLLLVPSSHVPPLVTRWNLVFLKCEFNLLGTSSSNNYFLGNTSSFPCKPHPSLV